MNKKSFILFVFLLIFWIVVSGVVGLQHIFVGIILSLFTVWFWNDLNPKLPSILYPRELLLFAHCILSLVGYVIKSNIDVAKTLLFSDLSESSMFLELEPGMQSDWGRVFLATCITITPGTATIDINPETNIFTVHALRAQTGIDLYYWRLITEIRNLETMVQRREIHVVDIGGIHGSNSISSIESNDRPNGN